MSIAASVVVVVAGLLGLTGAEATRDVPLGGLYHAEGTSPHGGTYQGLVRIVRFGDSYLVSWMIAPDAEALEEEPDAIGVGIVADDTFAVSYFGEEFAGVVVYRIEGAGRRLDGRWTGAGGDGVLRPETLTRLTDARATAARHEAREPGAAVLR